MTTQSNFSGPEGVGTIVSPLSRRLGRTRSEVTVRKIAKEDWPGLAQHFCSRTYQQGASYSERAALRVNARSELFAIFLQGDLIGLVAARVKTWPILPISVIYVHGGPLYKRSTDDSVDKMSICVEALERHYAIGFGSLLRIVPASNTEWEAEEQAAALLKLGFKQSRSAAYRTLIKKIDQPDSTLRGSFDSKWRTDLTRSEKAGLSITRGSEIDDLARFQTLYDALRKQKGFHVNQDAQFFSDVQRGASEIEKLVVHIAWAENTPVAGHVGFILGDTAVYLLGAANDVGRNLRASFLLQWEFMRHAREAGAMWYDLGGIDPDKNPDVYRFKRRMNGVECYWAGSFDLSRHWLFPAALDLLGK